MAISVIVQTQNAQALMRRVQKGTRRSGTKKVLSKVAYVSHRRLVQQTPKKWTGQTRRAWTVVHHGHNVTILNRSKIMRFLERGTRAHGPVRANFLFIPLTRRAFNAGPRGVRIANQAAASDGRRPAFRIGRDFILTKRVRGIRASHMVRDYKPFVVLTLKAQMRLHIRGLIRGGGAK